MLGKLLLLFIIVPLVELTLLLMFAHVMGHWIYSVLLVVITGTIGAWLARRQGMAVFNRIRRQLAEGQLPADGLVDAAMILLAGGLLLTPGMLTDAFGLSMLIPGLRRRYRAAVINWFQRKFRLVSFAAPPDAFDGGTVDSYVVKGHLDPEEESSPASETNER